jgi:hypothetical protein
MTESSHGFRVSWVLEEPTDMDGLEYVFRDVLIDDVGRVVLFFQT